MPELHIGACLRMGDPQSTQQKELGRCGFHVGLFGLSPTEAVQTCRLGFGRWFSYCRVHAFPLPVGL